MISLVDVRACIESFHSIPDRFVLSVVFHRPEEIASEARRLTAVGMIGLLPIARTRNGNQIALRIVPGQPLDAAPVVLTSHVGESCERFCSRLARFMAMTLIHEPFFDRCALESQQDKVLLVSEWLGDGENLAGSVVDTLGEFEVFDHVPSLALSAADPDSTSARFEIAHRRARSEPEAAADVWREAVNADPTFAPACALWLQTCLRGTDVEAIQQAAWAVFALAHAHDNLLAADVWQALSATWAPSRNPALIAAQTLAGYGIASAKSPEQEALWPAVVALAADEDACDGSAFLDAARQLGDLQHYDVAFAACQNAVYWRAVSQETAYLEALEYALSLAGAWNQPVLVDALTLALPEPKPVAPPPPPEPPDPAPPVTIDPRFEPLKADGVVARDGDFLLIYRYQRWQLLVESIFFRDPGIVSLAVLIPSKLNNLTFLADKIMPVTSLPAYLQDEVRCKVLPEADDYRYLLRRNLMYIAGGATTEDMGVPQLSDERRAELITKSVAEGGYCIFRFTSLWPEVDKALQERN